jgi:3-deoxy-D-manno-octulosonic-acid transferase
MSSLWVYPLYNALLCLLLPFIAIGIVLRWRTRVWAKGGDRWQERWGRLSSSALATLTTGDWWWIHAVSLGEVKAIETFIRRTPQVTQHRVLLSAVTPEALEWAAEQQLADLIVAAPFDLPWVVRRVFRVVRPELFISVESEFWPNLLREAKRAGSKVALINGRISERSFRSYNRVKPILKPLWASLDLFAVRQSQDADRFKALGVPPEKLKITGNLKYDLYTDRRSEMRMASESPVVVFGSTREGEESQLLPAISKVRERFPELRVIWAPRHLQRVSEVASLLGSHGMRFSRISEVRRSGTNAPDGADVIWDSMGDLLDAYRQADIAVIGGSFVPKGGQNPIEPAALKLPVIFGPSMENFQDVAEGLIRSGGAQRVALADFESQLIRLLENPEVRRQMGECAHRAVQAEQGATDRTFELLKGLSNA